MRSAIAQKEIAMGIQMERLDSLLTAGAAQPPVLNAAQRRHVAVYLELLQKSLDEVERMISLPVAMREGSLVQHDADLPDEFATVAAPVVLRLRERVDGLVMALRIPPKRRSRMRSIHAILTDESIRVQDYFSSELAGYGEVHPMVKVHIDPQLESLRSDLRVLLDSLQP
jgi:hypothetical protein